MMQGDACNFGFCVLNNAGNIVTPMQIKDMEITLGNLKKTYRDGDLAYYDGHWLFPVTQHESFGFWPSQMKGQIRILWDNGVVEGKNLDAIQVLESISKEVL